MISASTWRLGAVILVMAQPFLGCGPEDGELDEGFEALLSWHRLPQMMKWTYRQASSRDPENGKTYPLVDKGNKDFNNFVAVCGTREKVLYQEVSTSTDACSAGVEGHVIAASDEGPGFISRMNFAISNPLQPPSIAGTGSKIAGLDDELIRIYLDDLSAPVYQGKLKDWAHGSDGVFQAPFATWESGSTVSYLPISFRSRLRVTLDNLQPIKLHFFIVDMQILPRDSKTVAFAPDRLPAESLASARQLLAGGSPPGGGGELTVDGLSLTIPPAGSRVVLDRRGSGSIELLQIAMRQDVPVSEMRSLTLQATWDEQNKPAVDIPLADLFGVGDKVAAFQTLPLRVSADKGEWLLSFYLPMPFRRRAIINLANRGSNSVTARVSVAVDGTAPEGEWGYLHALRSEKRTPASGSGRYLVADISGRGKYVGTVMWMEGKRDTSIPYSHPLNMLEGDEVGVVDGEVRISGTGTEDYFNGGWYYYNGPFSHPFSALTYLWQDAAGTNGTRSKVSQMRWHVLTDEINFQRSFRLEMEYGAGKPELVERYSTVALYYLQQP